MPLDADAEVGVRLLDGFDDPVRRGGGDDEAGRGVLDGLMMSAVDRHESLVELRRQQHRQARVGRDAHVVRDRILLCDLMRQLARLRGRKILNQRAAAGDVQHLRTSTDRQERQVFGERLTRERELVRIALEIELDGRMTVGFAVLDGIDVCAAGEQQAVALA
jgi:hypothetical protein